MGRQTFSRTSYDATMSTARAAGSATHLGEERIRRGQGLDRLVDPAGNGLIRRSMARKDKRPDGFWEMMMGTPMLVETLLDTTGSMGGNVAIALDRLPHLYALLKEGDGAVLGRYDLQLITAIFGDVEDQYVLNRSHAEMGDKIAEQMTMMYPERGGAGNGKEDPQYGIFAAAYLTAAETNGYGLKTYHFTISDEPIYEEYDERTLIRVFGETVFDKVAENGHEISRHHLPNVQQVITDLQTRAHAFFLEVPGRRSIHDQWACLYGEDHVVVLPSVELLPQVQAAIIGLTEGVIDLQSMEAFLRQNEVKADDAKRIARSVAGIPIGAQAALPGFDDLPEIGALFKEKTDLWPFDYADDVATDKSTSDTAETGGWL